MSPRAVRASGDEDLGGGFLDSGRDPHHLVCDLLAAVIDQREQLAVTGSLRALADDQPQHRRLLDREVQLAQITEEENARHRRPADERRSRAAERVEQARARAFVDVIRHVTLSDLAILAGKVGERIVELLDVATQLRFRTGAHLASTGAEAVCVGAGAGPAPSRTNSTFTTAVLNIGCFETGSQAVTVSSFAARARPFGSWLSASQ